MECKNCNIDSKKNSINNGKDKYVLFKSERARMIFSIIKMSVSLILVFTGTKVVGLTEWAVLTLVISAYAIISYDVLIDAIKGLLHGSFFDEHFLMMVGTLGAMSISYFDEAVFVMVFYHLGEILEDYAEDKAKKSITELVNDMPLYAHRVSADGKIEETTPEQLKIGDIIKILPGEKIPVDGIVEEGQSMLNMASLTGESLPKEVGISSLRQVYSGSINIDGVLIIRVKKEFKDSTLSKILDLITSEEGKKSKSERFIERFSKIYTPSVVLGSVAVFLIYWGIAGWGNMYQEALYNACILLIISCPCALIISVPLAFFISIGKASKEGILIKGGGALENFQKADIFVFDKTGTLTKGNFEVVSYKDNESLALIASLEQNSTHPIAKSILEKTKGMKLSDVTDFENISGKGIKGKIDGMVYYLGNEKYIKTICPNFESVDSPYKTLYLASKEKYIGYAVISDVVKQNAKQALKDLKNLKVKKLVMLSGDNSGIANIVGKDLGIDEVYGDLLPEGKLAKLAEIKKDAKKTVFVGDGVNDAPALLAADAGVSMGVLGSDAANESADIVILNDDLAKLGMTKRIANKTMKIVYENIAMILSIKTIIIILSLAGYANMYLAILADVGTTVLAVLECFRLWRKDQTDKKMKTETNTIS